MHTEALTITTDQVERWGVIGVVVVALGLVVAWRLVTSLAGRLISALICVAIFALCWLQQTQIENSIRQCDPHVLFVHLEISNASDRARCVQQIQRATHPTPQKQQTS